MAETTGGKIFRGIVATVEVLGVGFLGYLGFRSLIKTNADVQLELAKEIAALNDANAVTPTIAPTEPPVGSDFGGGDHSEQASNRLSEWLNFWPDTAEEAARTFGGQPSDWKMSEKWNGTKVNLVDGNGNPVENYGVTGYKPIEWVPMNPNNLPYFWPKTPEEAAKYFFPDQEIDSRFLSQNEFGGWHLSEDHWMFDGTADKFLKLHRGEVAEGYTVGADGLMKTQDDRVWVAFGGASDTGVSISAKGQGMTIWMPGTDPNKIALEAGNEYNNNAHYRGANGKKLGPDAINFPVPPIYNAPGFSEISFTDPRFTPIKTGLETRKSHGRSVPLGGGLPQVIGTAAVLGGSEIRRRKNPFRGQIRFK